jgi:hypothetical protein
MIQKRMKHRLNVTKIDMEVKRIGVEGKIN